MSRRNILRVVAATLLVAAFLALWFSPLREHLTRESIRAAVNQIRAVWYAPIVYVLLYAVGCVVALPASIFVIAAGFIWGWLLGGCYAMVGGMLGAIVSAASDAWSRSRSITPASNRCSCCATSRASRSRR